MDELRIGYKGDCGGCVCLKEEPWPRGTGVAICGGKHNGQWCGRVLQYSRTGIVGTVLRPAWCKGKMT